MPDWPPPVGTAIGPPAPSTDRAFCDAMLPRVSRTFAVCIRLLPHDLEYPVLVAYLLCRVADTLEDTTRLHAEDKARLLSHFQKCLNHPGTDATPLRTAFTQPTSDEELLAREADIVLREFHRLPPRQAAAIRPWVQEMCSGMGEFAARERSSPAGYLATLETVDDLDRYCYYVAGTVGHLLTELFRQRDPAGQSTRYQRLKALATSFGLGLQLTNIIKDVGDDRRRGWTFVPRQLCQRVGIRPEDLQDPRYREDAGRVMTLLIQKAKRHLCDALDYSITLPRHQYRIRLFCLTSLYFAVRTIRLAERDGRLLDPSYKVKITRREVHRTVRTTFLLAWSNPLVRAYFRRLAGPDWHCNPNRPTPQA